MQCSKCDFDNPDQAKFCGGCGEKLERVCPECNCINPVSHKYCNECGQNFSTDKQPIAGSTETIYEKNNFEKIQKYLPKGIAEKIIAQKGRIEGQRKLVTVMFCDLVEFTSMSEILDPEEIYTILDKVQEILIHKVHDYEGVVNKMIGDGIMALFGAPLALEDAPQRAIRSAFAIHREITRYSESLKEQQGNIPILQMRIGIHSGPVVVGTIGNDLRVEFTAIGNTVNLASRLENIAIPGTTYVSGDTFKLAEGYFRFEHQGDKQLKGFSESVAVYRPIVPRSRRTRFDVSTERGLTPFVGREREIELLLDGFERVKAGRGQAFSIVSEAGVGKSRFLYEFRKALGNVDVTFIEGRCLSYSNGVAYHPVIDILRANFDILRDDDDQIIIQKVTKGLKILGLDLTSSLPYLLELLSVRGPESERTSISPKGKQDRLLSIVRQIALNGSEKRPLILVFEDLHWIDESSEEVLKYLLEGILGARVLLIFTYRPEFIHTWGGKSYHSQINLNRLSNRESLTMAKHLLGTDKIEDALEEFILDKTDGIPFFIEELLKSLGDLNIIEQNDGSYRIAQDIQSVTIPATIEDVIMARVDSLPEQVKDVLNKCSVIGRDFRHSLIARITSLTEQELLTHLSVLKNSELIYERGVYPNSTYVFKHALTQEVTYNSLLKGTKKQIHREIGIAIEDLHSDRIEENYELLAYHYIQSDEVEKALDFVELANQKAHGLGAMEEAKASFHHALRLLGGIPESKETQQRRIALLVNQGMVFMLLLEIPQYYELLKDFEEQAVDLENQSLLGAFYSRLGLCEFGLGYFDKAVTTLTVASELSEKGGNSEDSGFALAWLEWSLLYKGEFEKVLEVGKKLLRTMDRTFNIYWYAWGVCGISRAYTCLGRWDEAIEESLKVMNRAESHSDNNMLCFAGLNLCLAHISRGNLSQAIEYGELLLQKAITPADKAWIQRSLGWALCRSGEWKRGIELMKEALPLFKAGKFMPGIVPIQCTLGEGYLLAGDYEKANKTLKEAIGIFEKCGTRFYLGWAHRLLGEIFSKTSANNTAEHFEKSIDILKNIKAEGELAHTYASYGRWYLNQKDLHYAKIYLTKAHEIFERIETLNQIEEIRNELDF
jgi:class 3 adenylate cyclase/tetratricopeptide (TPR) repeat protein